MNIQYLFIDNIIVIILSFLLSAFIFYPLFSIFSLTIRFYLTFFTGVALIIFLGYSLTMIRFWRTPKRVIIALENEIVSPADGKVIYIKKVEANKIPVAIKHGHLNELCELTKTELLQIPGWLIGINMTPWDVHKNCSPIDGKIILSKHTNGLFLSLKKFEATIKNERNTYIIENHNLQIGVVQLASRLVKRIDTYVKEGDYVKKGEWLGMIRFGSQVDVILPNNVDIKISLGQQVYAAKTVIASI